MLLATSLMNIVVFRSSMQCSRTRATCRCSRVRSRIIAIGLAAAFRPSLLRVRACCSRARSTAAGGAAAAFPACEQRDRNTVAAMAAASNTSWIVVAVGARLAVHAAARRACASRWRSVAYYLMTALAGGCLPLQASRCSCCCRSRRARADLARAALRCSRRPRRARRRPTLGHPRSRRRSCRWGASCSCACSCSAWRSAASLRFGEVGVPLSDFWSSCRLPRWRWWYCCRARRFTAKPAGAGVRVAAGGGGLLRGLHTVRPGAGVASRAAFGEQHAVRHGGVGGALWPSPRATARRGGNVRLGPQPDQLKAPASWARRWACWRTACWEAVRTARPSWAACDPRVRGVRAHRAEDVPASRRPSRVRRWTRRWRTLRAEPRPAAAQWRSGSA